MRTIKLKKIISSPASCVVMTLIFLLFFVEKMHQNYAEVPNIVLYGLPIGLIVLGALVFLCIKLNEVKTKRVFNCTNAMLVAIVVLAAFLLWVFLMSFFVDKYLTGAIACFLLAFVLCRD